MSNSREPGSQELAETLTRGLQATASLIQSLSGEIRDNSVALAAFSADLKNLRENVTLLSRILKDGNGEDSLMTKTRLIEKWIEGAEDDFGGFSERIASLERAGQALAMQDRQNVHDDKRSRWQFWATLVPAVLGLVGSAFAIIFK